MKGAATFLLIGGSLRGSTISEQNTYLKESKRSSYSEREGEIAATIRHRCVRLG